MDVFLKLSFEEQKELLTIVIDELTPETIKYPEKIKDLLIKKIDDIASDKQIFCGEDGNPMKPNGRCCKNRKDSKNRYFNFYDDNEIFIDNLGYCWSKDDLNSYNGEHHPHNENVRFDDVYLDWTGNPIPLKMMARNRPNAKTK